MQINWKTAPKYSPIFSKVSIKSSGVTPGKVSLLVRDKCNLLLFSSVILIQILRGSETLTCLPFIWLLFSSLGWLKRPKNV